MLQMQQVEYANRMNVWINILESNFAVNEGKWKHLQEEINEMLLIYDFQEQGEYFSYKKSVVNLSKGELQQIFECLQNESLLYAKKNLP